MPEGSAMLHRGQRLQKKYGGCVNWQRLNEILFWLTGTERTSPFSEVILFHADSNLLPEQAKKKSLCYNLWMQIETQWNVFKHCVRIKVCVTYMFKLQSVCKSLRWLRIWIRSILTFSLFYYSLIHIKYVTLDHKPSLILHGYSFGNSQKCFV